MTVRKIANTANDATLPKTPVVIAGKTYNLCFDLGALAEAETAINAELAREHPKERRRVNLLYALPEETLASTRIVFAAALRTFHPEIGFDEACHMLNIGDLYEVATAVRDAWKESRVENVEPEKSENPQTAAVA